MKYSLPIQIIALIAMNFFLSTTLYAAGAWGRIDMSVSPISDEFPVDPGIPITRSIQYSNNSDVPYNIYVTIEDCTPSGNYGTPICKIASGSGIQAEFSSTWITVSESSFTVPPRTNKTITYTVTSPPWAAPGGYYGAVFFNNPDTPVFGSNTVGMIRRIGMLYMMQIPGNIIVNPDIGSILVDGPGGSGMSGDWSFFNYFTFNSAPELFDKIRKNWNSTPMWEEILTEVNPLWDRPMLENDPFSLSLKIPVRNDGNIHIRPTGKIYIFDENNIQLEKVWKESIIDENGIYIGERIVNYLPINDERGSVLPNTERTYEVNWLGFWYEERDPLTGKYNIKFENPGDHYTRLTEEWAQFIYPWERLYIRKASRTLKAKVEFIYNDVTTGEDVTKIMEIPLNVEYRYIAKSLNYWMIFALGFIIFFAWIFIRKRDKRIEVLEEENDELEDEISVLERAKKAHIAKKSTMTVASKKPVKKIAVTKSPPAEVTKKPPVAKKPVVKKPLTKKVSTNTEGTN